MGSQPHGELFLPGVRVRIQGDVLSILSESSVTPSFWNMPVDIGETAIPDGNGVLILKIKPIATIDLSSIRENPWVEAADAECITLPLSLRTRRSGDRFAPLGLGHTIKLKDFLMNERTAYFERDSIPLLCDSQGVIWVAGIRLSDTVKLSDRTQEVLVMEMRGVR